MKRGFFRERRDSSNEFYAEFFLVLKVAFVRVCVDSDLNQYRTFKQAVKAETTKPYCHYIWRWIDYEAYVKVRHIVKLLDIYTPDKPNFIKMLLQSSIVSLVEAIDEKDYGMAVDMLTAEIDAVHHYLQCYDDHCRNDEEKVFDEVLDTSN